MLIAPPRSLQRRLTLLILVLLGGVWVAIALQTWFDVRRELDELLDGHLAQAAALLVVQQMQPADGDGDDEHGRAVDAPSLHRYAPKAMFQVFHEGKLVQRSANAPLAPLLPLGGPTEVRDTVVRLPDTRDTADRREGKEDRAGRDGRENGADGERHGHREHRDAAGRGGPGDRHGGFATVTLDGAAWRVLSTRGAERDVQVFIGEQLDSRAEILQAVLRSTLWPLALALPLLALATGWAVHRGLKPLRTLGQQLAARRPQSLHPVDLPDAPTEMAPAIAALNGLFARIEALLGAERRFTADAAHELRTPIAAIRTQAQVAQGAADAATRQHALAATLTGCDRAGHLVDQLLTLSRLEAGGAAPATPVDLAALAREVVGELAPLAIARDQTIALEAPERTPVAAEATLLAVLLRNLVDNAIRYAPPQATVQVAVRRGADGGAELCVEDSGPGLGEADLARLGERFFRVLGSGAEGSGLGWSIVRRIAAVQGASVVLGHSASLGGLAVTLRWPAAA